jgi:hypothetical protein
MKKVTTTILAVIALLVLSTFAFAFDVGTSKDSGLNVASVKINGDEYANNTALRVQVGDKLTIRIKLEATDNVSDVEVAARIVGYRQTDREPLRLYDVAVVNRMYDNDAQWVTLTLDVPTRVERDNIYTLRIYVESRDKSFVYSTSNPLRLVGADNKIEIRRVSFDPAEVVAGRALRTRVRIENVGDSYEDDVYIKVSIPELGSALTVTADVGEMKINEIVTSEDLLLRIPECTKAGTYDVEVEVMYDDGYTKSKTTEQIKILADDACAVSTPSAASSDRTVITPPQSQKIVAGAGGASFPVVISNEGSEDKIYKVSVTGTSSWGSAEITNPTPLVKAGKSEVVYIYVAANAKTEGNQVFTISVTDGKNTRDIPVAVAVDAAKKTINWRNMLYVGVILLLILVIILGLIIGFNKAKPSKDEDYY